MNIIKEKWQVLFNPGKTVSMTISGKAELPLDLSMGNVKINHVTNHWHLGVIIQSNGKYCNHIRETSTKASHKVDQVKSLMHKLAHVHYRQCTSCTSGQH